MLVPPLEIIFLSAETKIKRHSVLKMEPKNKIY